MRLAGGVLVTKLTRPVWKLASCFRISLYALKDLVKVPKKNDIDGFNMKII